MRINHLKFMIAFAESTFTTSELAEIANVSRTIVSKILSGGEMNYRPQTIGKIAKALNMRVEEIILEE